ncbi:multicopper oxidase domain-containing protein [Clostridium sp. D2Q-11]|uniref:Multicopper oxidase domain-containing protein n=1 Tax=Anaeromonas frigoriresistens TaxID=2683708 RepID=A0A942V2W9_9FIRM|nr:multicopper oxidase domain-containing protein [Anaeromonas frigoriresistens]
MRHFYLEAKPIKHNILSNLTTEALGYNGGTPGPSIIMRQGEWIYLTVENKTNHPTFVHVHGLPKPNSQNGAPAIEPATPRINPGESYTYKILCWKTGTFFYHSPEAFKMPQGLIGAFIVLPNNEETIPHHDYVLLVQQWEILSRYITSIL